MTLKIWDYYSKAFESGDDEVVTYCLRDRDGKAAPSGQYIAREDLVMVQARFAIQEKALESEKRNANLAQQALTDAQEKLGEAERLLAVAVLFLPADVCAEIYAAFPAVRKRVVAHGTAASTDKES